jgi:hypothetical protein
MSEFFSGSKPELISMKSINELTSNVFGDAASDSIILPEKNLTSRPILKTPFNIKTFFINYIKPNLLPVIIILVFVGFLLYRYFSKDDQPNTETNIPTNKETNIPTNKETNIPIKPETNKEYFNPSLPISLQTDKMEYPTAGYSPPKYPNDKELETSIDKIFEKMKKKHGPRYDNAPIQDYCEYENPDERESVYMGNTSWIGQPDGATNLVYNENSMVSSTGNFVQFGIEKNRDANKSQFDELAKQIFN